MPVSPLGNVAGQRSIRILKVNPRLPICDNYNFVFISYRFRVINIFLWTGNDVMPVSPLGGVAGQMSIRILKGSFRLPICD